MSALTSVLMKKKSRAARLLIAGPASRVAGARSEPSPLPLRRLLSHLAGRRRSRRGRRRAAPAGAPGAGPGSRTARRAPGSRAATRRSHADPVEVRQSDPRGVHGGRRHQDEHHPGQDPGQGRGCPALALRRHRHRFHLYPRRRGNGSTTVIVTSLPPAVKRAVEDELRDAVRGPEHLRAGRRCAFAQREVTAAAVIQPEALQHRQRRRVPRDVPDPLVRGVAPGRASIISPLLPCPRQHPQTRPSSGTS